MLHLIIDTDTAGDDAAALLLALKNQDVKVDAVTVNCGNVSFDQEVENALYTVEFAGKGNQVPVYAGCRTPILKNWTTVEEVHGKDGMGNANFPKASKAVEKVHAIDAIVDTINDNPGEMTIVELAPMTNLALAIRKDPSIVKKIKHIYFMGGTHNYPGNVTPSAEFNTWVDPDAASIVLGSGIPMTMVGWDITMKYGLLGKDDIDQIRLMGTANSKFFLQISSAEKAYLQKSTGLEGITCPDSITMAIAIDGSIATRTIPRYVIVDNRDGPFRGAISVDDYNIMLKDANVNVVYEADTAKFKKLLFDTLNGS
ncbi:MAG: nucleoside hydrolase [Nitrososphaerota archaeon]|nr:nucleoside hydrolase [Nitrososphaerota archaeon]MDG7051407.1 nucleoside hydrolase [Nitrososphaerota archaeon]